MLKKIKTKVICKIKELYNLALDNHEKKIVDSILNSNNFGEKIINSCPSSIKRIAFIIPGVQKFSGGITSILRLGTYLSDFNYEIFFVDFTGQDFREIQKNSKANLPSVKGCFKPLVNTVSNEFDVVIAGNWQAVYYLNKYTAYKMYFVQDYEPYFFKLNERYLLAKLTYELGLHIVSLGKWNIEQITRECNTISKMDAISFPYEPSEYKCINRRVYKNYANKSEIKIAVYTKEEGKRIPNILQGMLIKIKKEFASSGIDLKILFFGLNKSYKPSIGINLGKLTHSELLNLYNECDFGLVASMTNISLVPYEMIATGLPLIEFENGSFKTFFNENNAILIDYNYRTLVKALKYYISAPDALSEMVKNANKSIENLSWKNTAIEFAEILKSICKGD